MARMLIGFTLGPMIKGLSISPGNHRFKRQRPTQNMANLELLRSDMGPELRRK
jgi:hypothetical protein